VRFRVILGIVLTLILLYAVSNRPLVVVLLAGAWWLIFRPFQTRELVLFVLAGVFFAVQDYLSLKAGLFEFRHKDILLMPYYEPLLWGFYFLSLKRFISEASPVRSVTARAGIAVVVVSLPFSLFASDSRLLLIATLCSTLLLFVLFHTRSDIQYAAAALALGFVIELFGVSTGLWWYPAPDFLGIPLWFATMWISVGLLGRRFLLPLSDLLAGKMVPQRV
jgi:hypothetical protein